jgi:hypothetical protein
MLWTGMGMAVGMEDGDDGFDDDEELLMTAEAEEVWMDKGEELRTEEGGEVLIGLPGPELGRRGVLLLMRWTGDELCTCTGTRPPGPAVTRTALAPLTTTEFEPDTALWTGTGMGLAFWSKARPST